MGNKDEKWEFLYVEYENTQKLKSHSERHEFVSDLKFRPTQLLWEMSDHAKHFLFIDLL